MQPGNILVGPDGGVTFIDFEYARFAPRGYDVANHWCEWAADYHGVAPHHMDYSKFPSPEQQWKPNRRQRHSACQPTIHQPR